MEDSERKRVSWVLAWLTPWMEPRNRQARQLAFNAILMDPLELRVKLLCHQIKTLFAGLS